MATQKQEIPLEDAELDALMAELADEVADAVDAPAATVAAAPAPEPEPTPEPTPEPVKQPEPTPAPAAVTPDDDLESLVAEIEEAHKPAAVTKPATAAAKPAAAVVKPVTAAPAPEPKPRPTLADIAPAPVAAVAAPAAAPNPPAKKAAPGLQFYLDPLQLEVDLAVSDGTLDTAQMQQASRSFYYSSQAAMAEAQAKRMKLRLEYQENKCFAEHRKAFLDAGEKATEKMVESAVKTDARWTTAKNTLIEAEFIAETNRSAAFAMKERRDMIIQMGADRREGMKGQTRTMAQDDMHREMKARALAASGN